MDMNNEIEIVEGVEVVPTTLDANPIVTSVDVRDKESVKSVSSRQSSLGADDPLYPREGKTLTWKNVNMTALGKGKNKSKSILSDVWGEVPAKQTTAIMGPSGAGKTSLLNILAGRTRSNNKLLVEGDILLNGNKVNPSSISYRKHIAFVAQDDSLQITATPREAILFSAKLRLPRTTTDFELDSLTTRMINALGLSECQNTYIGGPLLKGISGGERKRTSVGVELVVKPTEIFLDEPTSGLVCTYIPMFTFYFTVTHFLSFPLLGFDSLNTRYFDFLN
jgi:ABC-type lipoprotein export system ATPase subunit